MGGGTTRSSKTPVSGRPRAAPPACWLRVRNHPGTALTPGSARRVTAHIAGTAAQFIIAGLVVFLLGWAKTPQDWIYRGIGCLLGFLAIFGCRLAYRRSGVQGRVRN